MKRLAFRVAFVRSHFHRGARLGLWPSDFNYPRVPILEAIRKRWPCVNNCSPTVPMDRATLRDKAAYIDFVGEIIRRNDGQKAF